MPGRRPRPGPVRSGQVRSVCGVAGAARLASEPAGRPARRPLVTGAVYVHEHRGAARRSATAGRPSEQNRGRDGQSGDTAAPTRGHTLAALCTDVLLRRYAGTASGAPAGLGATLFDRSLVLSRNATRTLARPRAGRCPPGEWLRLPRGVRRRPGARRPSLRSVSQNHRVLREVMVVVVHVLMHMMVLHFLRLWRRRRRRGRRRGWGRGRGRRLVLAVARLRDGV